MHNAMAARHAHNANQRRKEDLPGAPEATTVDADDDLEEQAVQQFAEMDLDEDGAVTKAEMMDAAAKRFDEFDTDGDGKATNEEMLAGLKKIRDDQTKQADAEGLEAQMVHIPIVLKTIADENEGNECWCAVLFWFINAAFYILVLDMQFRITESYEVSQALKDSVSGFSYINDDGQEVSMADVGDYNDLWDWISKAVVPVVYDFKDYADENLDAWDRCSSPRSTHTHTHTRASHSHDPHSTGRIRLEAAVALVVLNLCRFRVVGGGLCRNYLGEYNRVVGGLFLLQDRGLRYDSRRCETAHTSFFPVCYSDEQSTIDYGVSCKDPKGYWSVDRHTGFRNVLYIVSLCFRY